MQIRELWRSASGNVFIMAALLMPVILGSAGLAVDSIQWVVWKRQLQRQADSAALAGAYATAQAKNPVDTVTADLNRTRELTLTTPALIESPPSSGSYAGNTKAVRVTLQYSRLLPFTGMFLSVAPTIAAKSTAAAVVQGDYCVLALDPTAATGITMQGSAVVNLGCGIAANSRAANAVVAGGSSTVIATPVSAVGGIPGSSNYQGATTLLPYSMPQDDPYALLPTPTVSGCGAQAKVQPTEVAVLNPGCYRGMDLKGTVTLNEGTYFIDGSSFSVGSQATVTGTNVTIVLTSNNAATNAGSVATLDINGGATVRLSAQTSGTYAGILFYQDRRAADSGTNSVNGNSSSSFQGAIYMAGQEVGFSGTTGMSTNCLQLVARRVVFSGNSTINNSCPAGSGASSFIGTRVRLVG
jgi:Flp pilus assembly protein TadG